MSCKQKLCVSMSLILILSWFFDVLRNPFFFEVVTKSRNGFLDLGMMLLLLQIDPPQKRNVLGQSSRVSEMGITKLRWHETCEGSWFPACRPAELGHHTVLIWMESLLSLGSQSFFSSSLIILCDSCSVTRSGCCNSRKPLLKQTN